MTLNSGTGWANTINFGVGCYGGCQAFPEQAQASAEEAGLGPFEIPGAIKTTASNCKKVAGAPAIANTLRKTIMQLVEHIKSAISSDEEPAAAAATDAAVAKP